jgi:hypothetical protein
MRRLRVIYRFYRRPARTIVSRFSSFRVSIAGTFHRKYSGTLIFSLYGLGVAMVGIGLSAEPFHRFFIYGECFFAASLVWAIGWWLNSEPLDHKKPKLTRRQKKGRDKVSYLSYRVWKWGVPILMVIAFVGSVRVADSIEVARELGLSSGPLLPSDDPSPSHSTCQENPPDAVFIYFGTAVVSYAPAGFTHHAVIRVGNHDLLSLDRDAKGVTVSAEIFDADGILVEIDHGKFKVYRPDFIKREHPDLHTLVVYDKWNNKRLGVRYLNPHAIDITGSFFYPGYNSVTSTGNALMIGTNRFSGGTCIGGAGLADILVDR